MEPVKRQRSLIYARLCQIYTAIVTRTTCTVYSGTPLMWTYLGPKILSQFRTSGNGMAGTAMAVPVLREKKHYGIASPSTLSYVAWDV